MKILITAPSAKHSWHSHDINALKAHIRLFELNHLNVICAVNRECELREERAALYKVFDYTIYDDFHKSRIGKWSRLKNYFYFRRLVEDVSNRLLHLINEERLSSRDCIFVPTLDWILMQAIDLVCKCLPPENLPKFHFLFMFDRANWMTGGYPFEKICQSVNALVESGVEVFAYSETIGLAGVLKNRLNCKVGVYPYPVVSTASDKEHHAKDDSSSVIIGVLGGGRRDKGFDRLHEIIIAFNSIYSKKRDVRFIIQAPRAQDNLSEEASKVASIENVQMLDNSLGNEQYEQVLNSCDVMLMPYSSGYNLRGSGVAIEALANAIPLVCSANTGLADTLTHENGMVAVSNDDFANALADVVDNLASITRNAELARTQFIEKLEHRNPVVENIKGLKE